MTKVRLHKLDGTDEIVEIPGIQRAIRVGAGAYLRVKAPDPPDPDGLQIYVEVVNPD